MTIAEILDYVKNDRGWSYAKLGEYLGLERIRIHQYVKRGVIPKNPEVIFCELQKLGYEITMKVATKEGEIDVGYLQIVKPNFKIKKVI